VTLGLGGIAKSVTDLNHNAHFGDLDHHRPFHLPLKGLLSADYSTISPLQDCVQAASTAPLLVCASSNVIMLSTQTKHINAYGKRGKRVVEVTASDAKSRPKELISIFDDLPPPPAWAPVASRMKGRENPTPKKKAPAPKAVGAPRKKRLSPPLSPVKKLIRVPEPLKKSSDRVGSDVHRSKAKVKPMPLSKSNGNTAPDSSARPPLSSHPINVPEPPAPTSLAGRMEIKQRLPSTKVRPSKSSKPASQAVKMDIIVLDDEGHTISKEQRISRTSVMSKPFDRTSKAKAVPIYIDSESEPELVSQPRQEKLRRRATRAVVSDDLASEDEPPVPQPAPKANPSTGCGASNPLQRSAPATKVLGVMASKPLKRASTVEVVVPPAPYSTKQVPRMSDLPKVTRPATSPLKGRASVMPTRAPAFHLPNSPVLKGRQLTPIRGGRSKGLFEPPSPPSPSTSDLDLSLDFADLSLECDEIAAFADAGPSIPTYLKPLLEECGQDECGPHDFSSFIDSFPFDPVLQKARDRHGGELLFKKIGEASYSEVFGIGDVVLKVIPLRDEFSGSEGKRILKARGSIGHEGLESEAPPPTDAQDVRKEIIVTRAMGEVHHGFVKLLKTYVVKGKYPEDLLSLWDEYYDDKGSESIRPGTYGLHLCARVCAIPDNLSLPDTFTLSQAYAIIVLPNGGPDMETYVFSNSLKSGWRQACSIFWQVAKSLAHAERLVSFEVG
jgi:serine/threonine-protein kinase haspin